MNKHNAIARQDVPDVGRRNLLKLASVATLVGASPVLAQSNPSATGANTVQLTQEWDKIFPRSNKVDHQKVTFKNRYGITLAADLYLPKNRPSGNWRRSPSAARLAR